MLTVTLKTPDQVRAEFHQRGETIMSWAKNNGFPPNLVYQVLNGQTKARYGTAHKVAVALNLKHGATAA
ncbi:phage-associated protein%2C BcepMu gp16 family [Yersinia aldovae]|uniref:DNA-binding protein n=1 Tax=Yersinia aldovae TaxID=29483 RepID=UPI0005E946EB|nr:DNA-binding protein [Yersinia aldovae]CNJ03806.1 phage-associated protein%2C BcepMu gp16 family [Yersinia aldovae]